MAPNTDPRDARVALLERLFQSAVGRADALEREVATLQEEKRVLQAAAERVEALEREVATLTEENAELRARLNLNSRNSSKPPSTDGPKLKRRARKPTGASEARARRRRAAVAPARQSR